MVITKLPVKDLSDRAVTFGGVLNGRSRLLAAGSLTGGLFNERTAAWPTTVLRSDDHRATSLLDAGATADITAGPAAPRAQNTVHRPCTVT